MLLKLRLSVQFHKILVHIEINFQYSVIFYIGKNSWAGIGSKCIIYALLAAHYSCSSLLNVLQTHVNTSHCLCTCPYKHKCGRRTKHGKKKMGNNGFRPLIA